MLAGMSNDAKLTAGVGLLSLAIIGSAWIMSYAMISLGEVVLVELRDLRGTLERVACGEFARQ